MTGRRHWLVLSACWHPAHTQQRWRSGGLCGLQNFSALFDASGDGGLVLKNTVLWSVMVIPGTVLAGLCLAVTLDRSFRGRTVFRTIFFLPAILSPVVIAFAWSWIFNPQLGIVSRTLEFFGAAPQGWLEQPAVALPIAASIEVWRIAGFFMLFYLAAMQLIPRDYYEAASLDGASRWRQTRSITLPLLFPMTTLMLLFSTINALRAFQMIWNLTQGGPNNATSVASISIYQDAFVQYQPQTAASMATILLIVGVLIAVALARLNARVNRSLR